jgi:tetratricopeptide (TPR) repeat protein
MAIDGNRISVRISIIALLLPLVVGVGWPAEMLQAGENDAAAPASKRDGDGGDASRTQAGATGGDAVAELPARWRDELLPVSEADISGAEPLMQQAITSARDALVGLLTEPAAERKDLAKGYGRLGALFLLVEVEARADACLRNAMTLDPDELRWPYYAGYLAMLAGNLDQAIAYLEQARAIDASYPTLYMRLGKVHLDRSELDQARAAFERVKDNPDLRSPAHYYLGQIAVLERRFADAVPLLETALEANPEATEIHYPLAQALRALGDKERARSHLEQFVLRAPDIADPLLAELEAATQRSLPAFERAIHAIRGGDYQAAGEYFRAGLDVAPDNAAARVSYARALYLAGQRDAAAEQLAQALQVDPEQVLGQFLEGVLGQQQGDLAGAAAAYRRTLALQPDHAGALFYLANLDFDAGRFGEALAGYEQALAADASIAPARILALIAALHAGASSTEILERLATLRAQHPDDPQLKYAHSRLLSAAADPAVRDPAQAMELAVELAVQQPIPPHQRAVALAAASSGDFDKAATTLKGLIDNLGWMAPPAELDVMEAELAAYRDATLPPPWPIGDQLLSPPPFDPLRPFRDYPATAPY